MPVRALILPSRVWVEVPRDSITLAELVRTIVERGFSGNLIVLVNDRIADEPWTLIRAGDRVVVIEEAPGG